MNGTRNWCTLVDLHPEGESAATAKSYKMVSNRSGSHSIASELVESNDGHEEIIKVYLKGKAGDRIIHEKNIDQLKSEVQYIQEVLLEKPNGFRQTSTALYKTPSETLATLNRYQREAEKSNSALQKAENNLEQRDAEILELQRCMLGMEKEQQSLLEKVREGKKALEELRTQNTDGLAQQEKVTQLEKEVATLREKIHHLDDMLKSQQRKVRQMIEQLQNSKTVIQSKDTTIQELQEKVAYLEAENLEMHDRMEHLIEKQVSPGNFSTQTRTKSDGLGSIRISKPPNPKPLPLIRVVET
ncbi:tuftelin isoform X5 [Monodelphis domestica]|uniref:tuftelin isoform X5 n=1 Tax=Monodelphis domestica TaxID=13616 RepID=UPI0004432179|nr:tuftelin isoform X5 [Monodelphis domestica]